MEINCQILLGEEFTYLDEACLVTNKGAIEEICHGFSSGAIDLRDHIAVPGLINAHTHIGDSFAKDACTGLSLHDAVGRKGRKWELYSKEKPQKIIASMTDAARDMLSYGTCGFIDFREGGFEGLKLVKNALKGLPIKATCLGRDLSQAEFETSDGLGLNIHQLSQIPKERKNKVIGVHAGEEEGETRKALAANPNHIVHFTKPDAGDIEAAAKKGISAVVCPRSNAALGVGFPPVRELIDKGVNVALGTDNVMINSPDLWREMEFLLKYSQLSGPLTPKEVLGMATFNAAKVAGSSSGTIDAGRTADIIFIDSQAPNMRDSRDLLSSIVCRCRTENISRVMLDGSFVLERDMKGYIGGI